MFRAILLAACIPVFSTAAAQTPPDHDQPQPPSTNGNPSSGGIVIFPPYSPPSTDLNPTGSDFDFPTISVPASIFPYTIN